MQESRKKNVAMQAANITCFSLSSEDARFTPITEETKTAPEILNLSTLKEELMIEIRAEINKVKAEVIEGKLLANICRCRQLGVIKT